MLADRGGGLVDDGVLRRAPALEREVEAGELELEPDHVRREHAEASSRSSWPVSSPSRTAIVVSSRIGVGSVDLGNGVDADRTQGSVPLPRRARAAIRDPAKLERIEALAIPPAWKDVWISPSAGRSSRRPATTRRGGSSTSTTRNFARRRSRRSTTASSASASGCPTLRAAMAEHLDRDELDRERVSAVALRLINLGWFRVGSERYARESGRTAITTLTRRHVDGARQPRPARLPRQARDPGADGARRRGARRAMRGLLDAARRRARLQVPVGGRALQPHEQAAQRLREALPRRGVLGEGLPDVGRHAARGGRTSPSAHAATASRRRSRAEALGRRRHAARRAASSETRRPSAAPHTSRRRSSSSISRGERSRISGRDICVS